MVMEYYWLKRLFGFTLICFTMFLISNINSCGISEYENYFNDIDIHCQISSTATSYSLSLLTAEETNIRINYSPKNNISTCRYFKIKGKELSNNKNLAINTNNISITSKYHTIRYTFVSFPLRC